MNDPYPAELLAELPQTAGDPLVNAITRLAQAIETLAAQPRTLVDNSHQPFVSNAPTIPPLAALPPVAAAPLGVAAKPACLYHGVDKVAASKVRGVAWYCQAKGGTGPLNASGFCTWSVAG